MATILVVSRSQSEAEKIKNYLANQNHKVTVASGDLNGRQLSRIAQRADVVIIDMTAASARWWQLLFEICVRRPLTRQSVAVIAVSRIDDGMESRLRSEGQGASWVRIDDDLTRLHEEVEFEILKTESLVDHMITLDIYLQRGFTGSNPEVVEGHLVVGGHRVALPLSPKHLNFLYELARLWGCGRTAREIAAILSGHGNDDHATWRGPRRKPTAASTVKVWVARIRGTIGKKCTAAGVQIDPNDVIRSEETTSRVKRYVFKGRLRAVYIDRPIAADAELWFS
jgi:hypothetical protein